MSNLVTPSLRDTERPEGICEWCWEQGREVELDGDSGELCLACQQEKRVCAAEALSDFREGR